jgi:hypothetical protein
MSISAAWPQVLDFFGRPLVIGRRYLGAAAQPGDVMAEGLAPGVRLASVSACDRALGDGA